MQTQQPHRIRCSEIWGGNHGDELAVETSGIRACLFSRPCDGGKGGDIYYFSVCGSDSLTRIAIADVVGHGEAVSDTSSWLYDSLAARMNSADGNAVLSDLNKASADKGLKAMSTATIAAFYRADSHLYFSYAGHHELLFLPNGESTWRLLVPSEAEGVVGLPLGVMEDCEFQQQRIAASTGDRLFLYTDGLIEAMNESGEEFGVERLLGILNEHGRNKLTEVRQAVLSGLTRHAGESLGHDDVTFMIVEIANDETGE